MSVNDAATGDIYVDAQGKLWRIISVCHEPTIVAEEVEGTLEDPNHCAAPYAAAPAANLVWNGGHLSARIRKTLRSGGVSAVIWHGWNRIWRPQSTSATVSAPSLPKAE